jgi:hypothetical protein
MVLGLDRRWGLGLGLNKTFKELIKNRLDYRLLFFLVMLQSMSEWMFRPMLPRL